MVHSKIKKNDVLTIGVIYRSPNSTQQQNEKLEKMIEEVVSNNSSHLLIMGDFNFPEIDWSTQSTKMTEDHAASHFLIGIQEGFLYQHVKEPTHFRALQKANILDLVLTNEEGMVGDITQSEPIGKSHHTVLNWKMKCYKEKFESKVTKYSYDKGNFEAMRRNLAAVDWHTKLNDKSVEQMWEQISEKIIEEMNANVPHRTYNSEKRNDSKHRKPMWMNNEAMRVIKKKKSAYQRYLETREGKDYLEYVKSRNEAKNEIRRAVRNYEKEISRKAKKDPKAFYKYVNSKLRPEVEYQNSKRRMVQWRLAIMRRPTN